MVEQPAVLEDLFQELNQQHFRGELPPVKLKWNKRLSSSAGRFCPGPRHPLLARPPEIEIASYLRERADGYEHIRDTMLHEMIHYYLWHQKKPYGHTPEFYRILKRVGAKRWNTVPKEKPVKYWYRCIACLTYVPSQREFSTAACAVCCDKYNGGDFHERFLLKPSAPPEEKKIPVKVAAPPPDPEPLLPPSEIVRRLEDLKALIQRSRTSVPRK